MITKKPGLSLLLCSTLVSLVGSACSPSSLFGNGIDGQVQNLPVYRRINTGCSQLDLSNAQMDVPAARKLVDCLNSSGALGGLANLVKAMTNEELAPFVDSINRSLLNDPKMLFKLERSFQDLSDRGHLNSTLANVGQLLKNDELIARSLDLFKASYVRAGKIDPLFLRAVEQLSTQLTDEKLKDGLDLGLALADARAFSSLWNRLAGTAASELNSAVSEAIIAYTRSNSRLGRELIDHAINGNLFTLADKLVPSDSSGIRTSVPGWASLLNVSLAQQGRITRKLGDLFLALQKPVSCMQGTRSMNHPAMDMLREMSELPSSRTSAFIQRDKLIQVFMAAPLCSFPNELISNYPALSELAASPAIEPMANVVRAVYNVHAGETHPLAEFMIHGLGDPGLQLLLPALSEITERGGWEDLLLLSTVPQLESRAKLIEFLEFLVKPLPGQNDTLTSSSVFDVLSDSLRGVSAEKLTAWLQSFAATDSGLASALRGMRAAYYVNNAHPGIELLRNAMADASKNPKLLEAMLHVSGRPEFQSSIRELNLMSRAPDGRLKDLIQTTLTLFHRYAERGTIPVETRPIGQADPQFRIHTRHNLAAADLQPQPASETNEDFRACGKIDLLVHWNDSAHPRFEEQLEAVSVCTNGDGKYRELADSLRMLSHEKTELSNENDRPRSIHALLTDVYNSFTFTKQEVSLLSDWGLAAIHDGRLVRALKAIPIWINHAVVRPLVDLADPVISDIKSRLGLQRLGTFGASVLKREDFQPLLAYVDDLIHTKVPPAAKKAPTPYDSERMLRWISNKECTLLPDAGTATPAHEAAKRERLNAVIDEFENSVINHGPLVGGKLRQSWTVEDLKTQLNPIFAKFANPQLDGPVVKSLMHFMSRFGDRKQYPKGYLEKWLRDRANDRRLISYMYPGETKPRVRLVNGLDRLSMVLSNADIYAPEPINMNFGMQFLANMAEAWGDVPFEARPAEIQAKYPKTGKKKCPTLAAAVADIIETAQTFYELVGFPVIPICQQTPDPRDPQDVQDSELHNPTSETPPNPDATPGSQIATLQANMYNIEQTVSALQENLDNGGLTVLRDLFFDLYYTGPASGRDSNAGIRNNLSVASRLVNVGILRMPGVLLQNTSENDPAIHDFFETMINGASANNIEPAVVSIFATDPNHDLIWNVMNQILALQNPQDIAHAKTIGLYGLAAISSLGTSRGTSANELLDPLLKTVHPIVTQYSAFLTRNADLVGDVVKSADIADFLQALHEDKSGPKHALLDLTLDTVSDTQRGLDLMAILQALDSSAPAHQAWETFRARYKTLDTLPEYRALNLSEIGRDGLNFLEGRAKNGSPLDPHEVALSRKMLKLLADQLERGDMELADQLLALAKRRPDDFHQLIQELGKLIENGEIPYFLEIIDRSIGKSAR